MKKNLILGGWLLVLMTFLAGCRGGGGYSFPLSSPGAGPVLKDCTYGVETDHLMKVDVADNKPIYTDPNWYGNKEEAVFVLIKRDASIPAWKVWGGYEGGETEEIGVTTADYPENPDSGGKRVFIGLGHCRRKPGETCLDPLPQTILFVLRTEGANLDPFPKGEDEPGFWWTFNVYFDTGAFEGNGLPKNENLPWWIKECVGGDVRHKKAAAAGLAGGDDSELPEFISRSDIDPLDPLPPHWEEVAGFYKFSATVNPYPASSLEKLGTYSYQDKTFEVFYTLFPEGLLHLIPESEGEPVFQYEEIAQLVPSGKKTLQLGAFNPVKKFTYEWWTPSCKPVIYFYPERPLTISVFLAPFGVITRSEPKYSPLSGWKDVLALPSGKLIYQGKEYPSLFYEGRIINVKVPNQGWVVQKNDWARFFTAILPRLGLNRQEAFDFQDYWLKRLKQDFHFVTFLPREEIERLEPMEISVEPEMVIRVRLFFKALEEPREVEAPAWPTVPERKGFTVVDWGGFYKG